MPKKLYYYCSETTFMSIISGKSIWLTSLNTTNDYLEGRWYLKLISEADMPEKNKRAILSLFGSMLVNYHGFAMCLSGKGDLLSQWRGYADNGAGYVIGFNYDNLRSIFGEPSQAEVKKVEYASELSSTALRRVDLAMEQMNFQFIDDTYQFTVSAEANKIFEYFYSLKSDAFSEEDEWRILSLHEYNNLKDLQFRHTKNGISPYKAIPFNSKSQIISNITLGPRNRTDADILKQYLKSAGFSKVEVKRSKLSYR